MLNVVKTSGLKDNSKVVEKKLVICTNTSLPLRNNPSQPMSPCPQTPLALSPKPFSRPNEINEKKNNDLLTLICTSHRMASSAINDKFDQW